MVFTPVPLLQEEVRRYLRTYPRLLVFDGYEAVAHDQDVLVFLDRLAQPSRALVTG